MLKTWPDASAKGENRAHERGSRHQRVPRRRGSRAPREWTAGRRDSRGAAHSRQALGRLSRGVHPGLPQHGGHRALRDRSHRHRARSARPLLEEGPLRRAPPPLGPSRQGSRHQPAARERRRGGSRDRPRAVGVVRALRHALGRAPPRPPREHLLRLAVGGSGRVRHRRLRRFREHLLGHGPRQSPRRPRSRALPAFARDVLSRRHAVSRLHEVRRRVQGDGPGRLRRPRLRAGPPAAHPLGGRRDIPSRPPLLPPPHGRRRHDLGGRRARDGARLHRRARSLARARASPGGSPRAAARGDRGLGAGGVRGGGLPPPPVCPAPHRAQAPRPRGGLRPVRRWTDRRRWKAASSKTACAEAAIASCRGSRGSSGRRAGPSKA